MKINELIEKQSLLALYAQLGQRAFTEICNLGFGRNTLYQDKPELPQNVSTEKLLQNLLVAGQLAEAMHNLPSTLNSDDFEQYWTWKNMCLFIEKNPQYHRIFQFELDTIFQRNHQAFAEIDADFVATIVRKGLLEHK